MDVREKLVDDVHGKLMGLLQRAPYIRCEDVYRQYAVNWLMNNGATVQEWISVKDRLPENEQNVLVADNGFIAVWTFYGDYWEDSHGWWQEFDEVTYWMPLPQPPKGE